MAKILLVDDEPNILKLSSFILKSLSYEVFTAQNGRKALEFLQDNHIDLVISDLIMPEMGGFELCEKIRDKNKVVIVSAMFDEFTTETVFKVGAIDFISKPFELSYLRKRLPVLLYYSGVPGDYQPPITAKIDSEPVYAGENVLLIGKKADQLSTEDQIRLVCSGNEFELNNITQKSEVLGQTIQNKAGGLRIFSNVEWEDKKDLIRIVNRTNCAVGDVTGLYFTENNPSAELARLFDRII